MKTHKIIIALLFAFFSIFAALFVRTFKTDMQEVESAFQGATNICERHIDVAFIKNDIWQGNNIAYNMGIFDDEISGLSGNQELRKKKLNEFGEQFLQLEMDVGQFVKNRFTDDAFILYLRAFASRIRQYGGSENEAVEFFFKGLEKYKRVCLMSIPNVEHLDEDALVKWDESLQWLRGSLFDNLNNIKRHLFDSYLIGVSQELQPIVETRFSEYYIHATQELSRVELENMQRRGNRTQLRERMRERKSRK